jgi:squalene-hopene/tetraprenyl-beta-curcumene cyclase
MIPLEHGSVKYLYMVCTNVEICKVSKERKKGERRMKKIQSAILIVLILSSTFTFLFFTLSTVHADSNALSLLEFNTLDNLEILQNGDTYLMNLKHYVNIPASPLADIYRQALGASNFSTEQEMPIPENVSVIPKIEVGENDGNASENIVPIREQFYKALTQEYDSSLGLDTLIVNSSMVPKGNLGECRIYADAMVFPRVLTTIPGGTGDTWTLWIGPTNTARFAEYVFTQITFLKMLLQQLPGEQVYRSFWSIRISLPDDAALLNSDEISNLSWLVDLGGGNCLEASLSVDKSLVLNETMIVTEQNTTMPTTNLCNAFQGYKSFRIEYSVPATDEDELSGSTLDSQNSQVSAADIAGARAIAATPAATGSAASDGDFSWSCPLKFPTLSSDGDSRDGDLPGWPDDAPAGSFLKYDASVNLVATFSIQWEPTLPAFGLDYFRSTIKIEAEARLNVEAGIGGWKYSNELKIFEIPVTKVTFFIGPVPVYVDLTLSAHASLDISFQVGPTVSAGYIATGWIEYGLKYDENGLNPIWNPGMTGEFIPPTLTPGTEVVAEITPSVPIDLWAKFYAVAGPDLTVEPYIDATFSYSIDTHQVKIEVSIGLKISFVFRLDDNLKKLLKPISNLNLGYELDFPLLHCMWTTHHDVGITNVRVSKTNIYAGDIVDISVTIKNHGFTSGHDKESFDVKVLYDDTQIGTKSISGLAEPPETPSEITVDFTWNTTDVPVGEHTIKAELLNINPPEESDGNDYTKNNIFETKVEISPVDFYITYSPDKTWYKPGEATETTVSVRNLRGVRTTFWLGASFKDAAEESEKYNPHISTTPKLATLNLGETTTFVVTWTIPDDAPFDGFKSCQIALNCWKDNTFKEKFIDNIEWADVFYVYKLQIRRPTASSPASAGDSENPNAISVSVRWIPIGLGSLLLKDTTFSVSIDNQPATVELKPISYLLSWIGLYELKVTPPAHLSQGFHDLAVTATLDQLTDSDTALSSIEYVTGPSVEPIQKGLAWLRTRQYGDGSWGSNVGVTSLTALAFLNAGFDETDTTVSKAINYILGKVHTDGSIYTSYSVYETSTAIMALVATHNKNYATIIENAKNWLVGAQQDENFGYAPTNYQYGGWTYSSGKGDPDLSNTQFALLALDAANLPKTDPTWSKAIIFTQRCQNRPASNDQTWAHDSTQSSYNDGGFIYRPSGWSLAGGTTSYGSMTGAGIWGLLLSGVAKTDERVVAAMNWVKNHYTWDTNPGIGWWRPYYYYLSMSKALTMYGEPIIDGHNWYQELYDKIVGMQIDAGSGQGYWSTSAEDYDPALTTAYAILSLQTRAVAPPVQRLSYLTFILRSNCLIRITDSEGNLVGYNYMTGTGENNIPTAVYSGPFSETQYIVIVNPKPGTYKLELVGISQGQYTLTIQGNYGEEVTKTYEYTGDIGPAELHGSQVTVTAIVGPIDIYTSQPARESVHDVAVTSVVADRTWVYQGFSAKINVTVLNRGDFAENVNVTLYYNVTANKIIGTQNITLLIGESKTLLFVWNTAGVPYCHNYTLTAVATIPADYTPADNTLSDGNIKVRILGDINGDGTVDMADISIVINAFLTLPGHPLWNPSADINNDNSVDMLDISIAIVHFMQP